MVSACAARKLTHPRRPAGSLGHLARPRGPLRNGALLKNGRRPPAMPSCTRPGVSDWHCGEPHSRGAAAEALGPPLRNGAQWPTSRSATWLLWHQRSRTCDATRHRGRNAGLDAACLRRPPPPVFFASLRLDSYMRHALPTVRSLRDAIGRPPRLWPRPRAAGRPAERASGAPGCSSVRRTLGGSSGVTAQQFLEDAGQRVGAAPPRTVRFSDGSRGRLRCGSRWQCSSPPWRRPPTACACYADSRRA